jgi:hypothetical protein
MVMGAVVASVESLVTAAGAGAGSGCGKAAGCAGASRDAPQERQNLFPVGFAALQDGQETAFDVVVWDAAAGAASEPPHDEQNLFSAGLLAPQAGQADSGWPDMKDSLGRTCVQS